MSACTAPFIDINGVPQPANGTPAYAALLATLAEGRANTANGKASGTQPDESCAAMVAGATHFT